MIAGPRAACTIRRDDIVDVGGRRRLVAAARTDHSTPASPRIVLQFRDGGPTLRLAPGTRLNITRSLTS
ncbi:hypothetical protein ACFQ2B_40585 [Streptomyces stramineus]|uniref:hypothetical protein n=1 Tax=Streptomyces sp. NPDC046215 TaxID=3155774 RepID=UPI0033EE7B3B